MQINRNRYGKKFKFKTVKKEKKAERKSILFLIETVDIILRLVVFYANARNANETKLRDKIYSIHAPWLPNYKLYISSLRFFLNIK